MKHFGSTSGLTALVEDQATPANGMVAYVTSSYNSGYQNGDIKGAFLADTDDTDLVGSGELVTNGTFDTDTDWTLGTGWTISGGVASSAPGLSGSLLSSYSGNLVEGRLYLVEVDLNVSVASNLFLQLAGGSSVNIGSAGTRTERLFLVAGSSTSYDLNFFANTTFAGSIDNISVKLADADRSVSANGLVVNGTITRTPVATGAELVAYSGFNASNYLEGTDASYVDTLYALGWEQTGGVWEFNHGAVSTAPIDGLTITGTTLKIAGTKPKALIRLTATTPSAEQLAKIEADEGALFQENAQATLYGASDAVTALAHDPVTDLLHVGASAGRSIFEGLRRVGNTTTSVSTAISASGGLVVEK